MRSYRPHLEERDPISGDDWSHSPFIRLSYSWSFSRRYVHSLRNHFIFPLIISDRSDWGDTRGKGPLARNPNRGWWHRHISLKPFLAAAPWTAGFHLQTDIFTGNLLTKWTKTRTFLSKKSVWGWRISRTRNSKSKDDVYYSIRCLIPDIGYFTVLK